MIIHAHHRSRSLALRHLAALRRKWDHAEILSRRNAKGAYSARGHFYVFEVRNFPKGELEIVVQFDYVVYSKKKGKRSIRFQIHVTGPRDATDAEAIQAIKDRAHTGKFAKGWKLKAISWGKTTQAKVTGKRIRALGIAHLERSAINIGQSEVIERKTRRTGKDIRK